jgi:AraC-like DNA-binding protein
MPVAMSRLFPSGAEEFTLLSEEMASFLVRFGPHLTAGRLGISERTLRRLFERRGLRLADQLKQNRRRLTEHLLPTDLSLQTISERLGFGSTQAFAHFMRREFGETATATRKRLKADP